MTRTGSILAAAVAAIALAPGGAVFAASATLAITPQAGLSSAPFSATYTFPGSHCNNEQLEIRWNSLSGALLQQVAYSGRCGTVTVGGLHPPTGTTPAQYAVWALLVQNGAPITGTEASAVYTVNPPPPLASPSPKPASAPVTPPPTGAGSAGAGSATAATASSTGATRPAGHILSSGSSGAVATSGSSQTGGLAQPVTGCGRGASSATCAAASPANASDLPPLLLTTGRWILASPLSALAISIVAVAAVVWWVYGTPLPGRLARRRLTPTPATEAAAAESADPEPPAAREIYQAVPSGLYLQSALAAQPPKPSWTTSADGATPAAAPAAAVEPSDAEYEYSGDGLPMMAPPPRH